MDETEDMCIHEAECFEDDSIEVVGGTAKVPILVDLVLALSECSRTRHASSGRGTRASGWIDNGDIDLEVLIGCIVSLGANIEAHDVT